MEPSRCFRGRGGSHLAHCELRPFWLNTHPPGGGGAAVGGTGAEGGVCQPRERPVGPPAGGEHLRGLPRRRRLRPPPGRGARTARAMRRHNRKDGQTPCLSCRFFGPIPRPFNTKSREGGVLPECDGERRREGNRAPSPAPAPAPPPPAPGPWAARWAGCMGLVKSGGRPSDRPPGESASAGSSDAVAPDPHPAAARARPRPFPFVVVPGSFRYSSTVGCIGWCVGGTPATWRPRWRQTPYE